jgi:hypothetical protein
MQAPAQPAISLFVPENGKRFDVPAPVYLVLKGDF